MDVVTRFAPSPTGGLHLGHAFSAVRAFDLAAAQGGRFLVRIEDIDGTRSRAAHVESILADLAWLGLNWEGPVFQSARLELYAKALERLKAMGLVYPCFCTRAAVAAASLAAPHGVEARYPGTCRGMVGADVSLPHCWRLDVEQALLFLECLPGESRGPRSADSVIEDAAPHPGSSKLGPGFCRGSAVAGLWWHDETAGWICADPARHGDVIIARKDAPASYHLAVTVDDAAQGVTDVVRGRDLFAATDIHRLLQALLGLPTPRYHHHRLLTGPDGERLAKRHDSPTLAAMRWRGEDGRAVADALRRDNLSTGAAAANA